jgi:hypothetical protein
VPLNVLLLFCQVVIHTIRLPKQSTVGDVINDLKTKVILQFFAFQNWMSDSIIIGTVIIKITITCIPRPSENIYFLTVLSPLLLFTKFACIVKRIKKKKNYCCVFEQVELSHPNAELRLLEVFYHKIYKVLDIVPIKILFSE